MHAIGSIVEVDSFSVKAAANEEKGIADFLRVLSMSVLRAILNKSARKFWT